MRKFSCDDVVAGCTTVFEGESEAEILQSVAAHASSEHDIPELPAALIEMIRGRIVIVE